MSRGCFRSTARSARAKPARGSGYTKRSTRNWYCPTKNWYGFLLRAVCEHFRIDMQVPVKNLPADQRDLLLYGPGKTVRIPATYYAQGRANTMNVIFSGIVPLLERRWRDTESDSMRQQLEKYMTESPCDRCAGRRLRPEALLVRVGGKSIAELCAVPIPDLTKFFHDLQLTERDHLIAERILKEITSRVHFLDDVGLGYLSLNRSAVTLAGGESQRIRLASQIGSRLTGRDDRVEAVPVRGRIQQFLLQPQADRERYSLTGHGCQK